MISVSTVLPKLDPRTLSDLLNPLLLPTAQSQGTMLGELFILWSERGGVAILDRCWKGSDLVYRSTIPRHLDGTDTQTHSRWSHHCCPLHQDPLLRPDPRFLGWYIHEHRKSLCCHHVHILTTSPKEILEESLTPTVLMLLETPSEVTSPLTFPARMSSTRR
jgi:hypothetical protein